MTKAIVCGGRNYDDEIGPTLLHRTLSDYGVTELAQGGAKGADELARNYATWFNLDCREYPADWDTYGKLAGPIRNKQMLDEFKPDLVIAFPGGKGTAHMVSIAKSAGVEVVFLGAGFGN